MNFVGIKIKHLRTFLGSLWKLLGNESILLKLLSVRVILLDYKHSRSIADSWVRANCQQIETSRFQSDWQWSTMISSGFVSSLVQTQNTVKYLICDKLWPHTIKVHRGFSYVTCYGWYVTKTHSASMGGESITNSSQLPLHTQITLELSTRHMYALRTYF